MIKAKRQLALRFYLGERLLPRLPLHNHRCQQEAAYRRDRNTNQAWHQEWVVEDILAHTG